MRHLSWLRLGRILQLHCAAIAHLIVNCVQARLVLIWHDSALLGYWPQDDEVSQCRRRLLLCLHERGIHACAGNELSPTTSYDDSSGVAVNLALEDLTAGQNSASVDSPRIKSSDSNPLPPLSPTSKAQAPQTKAQPAAETQSSYRYLNPLGVFGRVSEALRRYGLPAAATSAIMENVAAAVIMGPILRSCCSIALCDWVMSALAALEHGCMTIL